MKHAPRAYWLPSLAALALLAALGGWMAQRFYAADPGHLQQALLIPGGDGSFEPLSPELVEPPPAASARTVTLPHTWPQKVTPPEDRTPQVTWLQFSLEGLPATSGGLMLYLPRWQTIGRIAVYGDNRLLFRSVGDVVWNGFNHPLWVPLDGDGTLPRPRVLRLRIDSAPGAGGAVSSAWVGAKEELLPRYRLRRLLQTGFPHGMAMAFAGLGVFALAVWAVRRERTYALFAVFTLLWVLRGQRFHAGLEPLLIPAEWFGWITINSGNALLLTWYAFMCTLVPTAPRWPLRALLVLLAVSSLATLPWLSGSDWLHLLSPLPFLVTNLAGIPLLLLMAWAAWRHGGREGMVAASIGLLHVPVAVHDWMMQSFLVSPEHIYAWPFSTTARTLMFLYVIISRYTGALDAAGQATQRMAQRLREREAELAGSYDTLRAVQHREVLGQERRRLMQDIHDGMGSQLMSALKVAEKGKLTEAQMAQVLRECIDDLKLTVDSLESVEPDLLLLLATLRYRLAPRLEDAGLRLRWEVVDVPPLDWLEPRSALYVLRILQEGVSNVLQHAGARELRVSTGEGDGGVYVLLEDDGQGFRAPTGPVGRGLSNMVRRAQAIGAEASWEPTAQGTRFRLWLPKKRFHVPG